MAIYRRVQKAKSEQNRLGHQLSLLPWHSFIANFLATTLHLPMQLCPHVKKYMPICIWWHCFSAFQGLKTNPVVGMALYRCFPMCLLEMTSFSSGFAGNTIRTYLAFHYLKNIMISVTCIWLVRMKFCSFVTNKNTPKLRRLRFAKSDWTFGASPKSE